MELGVAERMVLLSILPKEGDLLSLRIIRDLQASLSFSEEEHVKYEIKFEGGNTSFKETGETKGVEIGKRAKEIIQEAIDTLDKKKQLNIAFLPFIERFLGDKEGEDAYPREA